MNLLIQKLKQQEIDEKIKKNLADKNKVIDEAKVNSGPQVTGQINEKKGINNTDMDAGQQRNAAQASQDQIAADNQNDQFEDEYFDHDYEDEE